MCWAHVFCLKCKCTCLISPVYRVQALKKTWKAVSAPRTWVNFLKLRTISKSEDYRTKKLCISRGRFVPIYCIPVIIYLFIPPEMLLVCFMLSGSSEYMENFNEKERMNFHCPEDLRLVVTDKESSCLLIVIAVMSFSALSSKVLWL